MLRRTGLWLPWILLGVVVGIAGGLLYAWQIDPRVVTDVRPYQLQRQGRTEYLIALSLAYARERDLLRAATRLNDLGQDWQALADAACELMEGGYARSSTGLVAVQAMVDLAASQGATGCASGVLMAAAPTRPPTFTPIPSPTPSLTPAFTKTPTGEPTLTPAPRLPTLSPTPPGDFDIVLTETLCDVSRPNRIEIFVRNVDDTGIPAAAIEVIWDTGRERFFTGMMPERDPGYADFSMTPGRIYQVQLPGLSARTQRLEPGDCSTASGSSQWSYRVIFERRRTR